MLETLMIEVTQLKAKANNTSVDTKQGLIKAGAIVHSDRGSQYA